jgi:hypothetical protein
MENKTVQELRVEWMKAREDICYDDYYTDKNAIAIADWWLSKLSKADQEGYARGFREAIEVAGTHAEQRGRDAERREIRERMKKDGLIHAQIIEMHDIAPFEWHIGNINALTEQIAILDALITRQNNALGI